MINAHDVVLQPSPAWEWDDTQAAHKAWTRYVALRRARKSPRRPIADVLVGAFAVTRQGLLTRNPSDFAPFFPDLPIGVPHDSSMMPDEHNV